MNKIWWFGMLALGLALGCSGDSPGPGESEIARRFIEEDPDRFFERIDLLETAPVDSWEFRGPEDLEGWEPRRLDRRFELDGGHLVLSSSTRSPRLVRDVDIQAETVDALEMQVSGFGRGTARLHWATAGETRREKHSLMARRTGEKQPLRLVFDVAFHPSWRGRIEKVEIELGSVRNKVVRLHRVRLLEYRPIAERLAAAVERSWKVELDHQVRNAFLALPGVALERRLSVPPGAVLHFGFGLDASARRPVVVSASLDVEGGDRVLLFEDRVDPGEPEQAGRWHDHEIDLEPHAGASATLVLETRTPAAEGGSIHDLVFWANPEVWRPAAGPPRRDVVVVSIDTLRADHLSLYGYPRPTSPFLDRWARRRAVVFENAVATSPWTIPSHLSLFTGLDALRHGVNHHGPAPGSLRLMAEYLREAGYSTLAITGGGFMHPEEGFAQGFDRYRFWPEAKSESEIEDGIQRALDWVESHRDRPFFLFFHTYEVHYPFRRREPFFSRLGGADPEIPPELALGYSSAPREPEEGFLLAKQFFWRPAAGRGKRARLTDDDLREVVDWYDSGIGYADSQLARLLTRLDERPGDPPVVIVTSDHGEALGEKGLAGHAYLYDFNLLVPLVIASPLERRGRERIETQVSSVDILPTVLELAGLDPPERVDGVSLVPILEGREASRPREAWSYAAFSNHGLSLRIDNRLKYFFNNTAWAPLQGREALYDLRRDPGEERDLAAQDRGTGELRQRMLRLSEESSSGLEVRFVNAGGEAYRGRLRGHPIQPAVVKSFDLPASALAWHEHGRLEVTVPPGADFRVFLERAGTGPLRVEGTFAGAAPVAATLDARNLQGSWRLGPGSAGGVSDAGWPGEEEGAAATGIYARWPQGVPQEAPPDPAAGDPELMARLRALGYVE